MSRALGNIYGYRPVALGNYCYAEFGVAVITAESGELSVFGHNIALGKIEYRLVKSYGYIKIIGVGRSGFLGTDGYLRWSHIVGNRKFTGSLVLVSGSITQNVFAQLNADLPFLQRFDGQHKFGIRRIINTGNLAATDDKIRGG